MTYFPFDFTAPISLHGVGKAKVITYKVLFMPAYYETMLPFDKHPRLRVEGEIADVPIRGAWIPVGDGRRYFIVPPAIKKNTGADVGDAVEMRFRIDDQDHVDIPPALLTAIQAQTAVQANWDNLTAGKKRMFATHVASARTPATEQRRIAEVLEALRHGLTVRAFQFRRKPASG